MPEEQHKRFDQHTKNRQTLSYFVVVVVVVATTTERERDGLFEASPKNEAHEICDLSLSKGNVPHKRISRVRLFKIT